MKEKIDAKARKLFQYGLSDSNWAGGSGIERVGSSHEKFSGDERRAERRMRLFGAESPVEFRKAASGSERLWLRDRKARSQVVDINRWCPPGRGAVGQVR